jgi:hypothetical protein
MSLTTLPALQTIRHRLPAVFPDGLEDRQYCVREMAVNTIFVMFYIDAVEGQGHYMRPNQVSMMSHRQAEKTSNVDRMMFKHGTLTRKKSEKLQPPPDRWYAENTREPIRDETLQDGLMKYRAVQSLAGVPTTSDKPRYYLNVDFANLFLVPDEEFDVAADAWREKYLSKDAMRRVALLQQGAIQASHSVTVHFPDGAGQFSMGPGESSVLTKAFVEYFAATYLEKPIVLFISESGNKKDRYLNDRITALGLKIDTATLLPDVMLADLGTDPMRLVFAEIVHSDGPIREDRKLEFLKLASSGGFTEQECSFVTAFSHRDSSQFKKAVSSLAWGAFAWFMNEPDKLMVLSLSGKKLGEH